MSVTSELAGGPIAALIRARGAAREQPVPLQLADPPAQHELRDSLIDAYLGARRGLVTLSTWVEQLLDPSGGAGESFDLDAGERSGDEEAHRAWAQLVAFGLCAPVFARIAAVQGDWIWQRATHGNLHGELDDLDVEIARNHAEDALEQTLLGGPIGFAMAGVELDEAVSLAWNPLEAFGSALDAMACFGGRLGADPVVLTEAAGAADLARIGERVEQRFYQDFLQVGADDVE